MAGKWLKQILPEAWYKHLREAYRRRAWKNARYHCPCCGMRVQIFWPFIADGNTANWEHFKRDNYLVANNNCVCPFCGSLPRQRMCAQYLIQTGFSGDQRVLLFAPEPSLLRFLAGFGSQLLTADLKRCDVDVRTDIEDTHLQADGFDLILCNHVLQHVKDYRRALQECARLLSSGGCLLLTVAMERNMPATLERAEITSAEQRRQIYGEDDYLRLFGQDLEQVIMDCGLIPELVFGDTFPPEILPINGPAIQDADILFVCRKN